jgi:hypothetical protein
MAMELDASAIGLYRLEIRILAARPFGSASPLQDLALIVEDDKLLLNEKNEINGRWLKRFRGKTSTDLNEATDLAKSLLVGDVLEIVATTSFANEGVLVKSPLNDDGYSVRLDRFIYDSKSAANFSNFRIIDQAVKYFYMQYDPSFKMSDAEFWSLDGIAEVSKLIDALGYKLGVPTEIFDKKIELEAHKTLPRQISPRFAPRYS